MELEQERRAQRRAIREAAAVSIMVASADDGHDVPISKRAAYRLIDESPRGWTVWATGDMAVQLVARGSVSVLAVH